MKILSSKYMLPISEKPIIDGSVVIESDKIVDVGSTSRLTEKYPQAVSEDFGESILMPGLVNSHSHLELTILRSYLDQFDDDFASWLISLTHTRAKLLTDDDIKLSAVLGAVECVRSGVTCVADIGRFGQAGFEALKKNGLRGALFQETEFSPDNETADEDYKRLRERFVGLRENETQLVKVGLSPHAPYTVSRKLFENIVELSLSESVPLTTHASESNHEELLMKGGKGFFAEIYEKENVSFESPGMSTIQYLFEIGVLATKPLLAHCVKVSEEDVDLIVGTGSRIAHCPISNAKFGHGIAPFDIFLDRGIAVGLGSDSMASNNTCDLFEEARFATLAGRVRNERGRFVHAEEIVKTATIGGASAMGLEDRIGTLEIGKQADIIIVSTKDISQTPVYNVYSALVFTTTARDVVFSMVDGRELYNQGEFALVDEQDIRIRAEEIAAKIK